jgi:hypothetical protein
MQQGFVNEILVHLKSRIYEPEHDVVLSEGDKVSEVIFI